MPHAVTAATISVRDTLALLDHSFAAFAAGVAEDRYALWLGSGISLGRVDGLKKVIPRVLEFLRTRITAGDSACRFKKALEDALDLAQLTEEQKQCVDFMRPFAEWPDADTIVYRLVSNYARLLDITIDGEPDDYILWNGVDIIGTFANPTIEPDVEHLCIAILILEGVASEIASANWDGLIEKAVDVLTGGRPAVVVCVRPQDLREPNLKARLFKFHGCAVKAKADEAEFRRYLVGRQSQIHGWIARGENAAMVHRLIDLIAAKPTLMMGLSAQDANIQALFAHAQDRLAWPWPGDRPSYVFSEDELGVDQQGLLRNVYRDAYTPTSRQQIIDGSLIRAYAKPLLVALVLHVMCSKLQKLIELATCALSVADREDLQNGVVAVRNLIAAAVGDDQLAFVKSLIEQSSRAIAMFRDGRTSSMPQRYNPITPHPLQQMAGDVDVPASGLREAAVAVGILGVGVRNGAWTLNAVDPTDRETGTVGISSSVGSAKVVFVANGHAALRLQNEGCLTGGDETILVHSLEITPALPRSPRSAPGRTGRVGPRQVSIVELIDEVASSAELFWRFREEVAI